jgi:hypothetical protein
MERLDRNDNAVSFCGKGAAAQTGEECRGEQQGTQMFHVISLE